MEDRITRKLRELAEKLPKFPDGRIDYTNSDTAVVVSVVVKCKGKVLLLKRSDKVLTYKGVWGVVAGYLDEIRSVEEIALKEIYEEIGVSMDNVSKLVKGATYTFTDEKTWIVCPVLVELRKKPELKLDWENTEYRWIERDKISEFELVPNLEKTFESVWES